MFNLLIVLGIFISGLYPGTAVDYSGVIPVEDRELQKRLTEEKSYFTKPNDNLVKVAYRVYGHRTWWSRLKILNAYLVKYGPYSVLPEKIRIRYMAPLIGAEYVVRANDTLSRIAEWKYGDLDLWKDVYEKNKLAIDDPDIIEPGEVLGFGEDGTIKKIKTGEVLVQGLNIKKEISGDTYKHRISEKIVSARDTWSIYKDKIISNKYYLLTLVIILLMLLVFIYITFPRRIGSDKYLQENMNVRLNFDELNLRPNYFSLLRKWWKKYLKFF
jgi:hypothetical protein